MTNKIRIYYRARTARRNVYSFLVSRKHFSEDLKKVYLSNYRINKCECDCSLFYGDLLDFSRDPDFIDPALSVDVYRLSGRLYRGCRADYLFDLSV